MLVQKTRTPKPEHIPAIRETKITSRARTGRISEMCKDASSQDRGHLARFSCARDAHAPVQPT